jgi:hypothetical protein
MGLMICRNPVGSQRTTCWESRFERHARQLTPVGVCRWKQNHRVGSSGARPYFVANTRRLLVQRIKEMKAMAP